MTQGRKGEWADTPLAVWLREQLAGKPKKWLIRQLTDKERSETAASAWVTRATFRGEPESAEKLSDDYIRDLTRIFGQDPRRWTAQEEGLAEDVRALRGEVAEIHGMVVQVLAALGRGA